MKGLPELLMTSAIALAAAQPATAQVVPPDQAVAGKSQRDWSMLWWQWAESFEDMNSSPIADRTGQRCAAKQSGDVWFLAGTYGPSGSGHSRTIRTCRIPKDKYLFFPLINYVVYPRAFSLRSCRSIIKEAAQSTAEPSGLLLEVDGIHFENLSTHRQATTQCFDIGVGFDPPVRHYPSAANGYYVMLSPLPSGKHTIRFGGTLPGMRTAVTYSLEVE